MSTPSRLRHLRPELITAILVATSLAGTLPAAEHAKLASQGRLDLVANAEVGELTNARIIEGSGSIARMNWLPAAEQSRALSIHCDVSHLAWSEFAIQFTPKNSGQVSLALMGPWEQVSPGVLYQQEVQWDALSAEGATIANGGFENVAAGKSTEWTSRGGRVLEATAGSSAAEGKRFAQTWHNAPLVTQLQVTGGKPVIVRMQVRAAVPEDFQDMPRILDRDTPAHRAAKQFLRGANFGNYLEVPPDQTWAVIHTAADMQNAQSEGFDHIRLPVGWHHYTGPAPANTIDPAFFAKVDPFVEQANKLGLGLIINIHHFDEFTTNPAAQSAKFLAIWQQVAAHYADQPNNIAFELLNEPKDAATTQVMNDSYAKAIPIIRATNPHRTIFVGPGLWNRVAELKQLRLPAEERNVIVTVHCYDPFRFTHQGASWTGTEVKQLTGVRFPGPPATPLVLPASLNANRELRDWVDRYNRESMATNPCGPHVIESVVQQAKQWSDYYGRPVHFGEFGAYTKADSESRANYYRVFRKAMSDTNIGWAIWDWKAGFRYWDDSAAQPVPGMREALFGG